MRECLHMLALVRALADVRAGARTCVRACEGVPVSVWAGIRVRLWRLARVGPMCGRAGVRACTHV